MISSINSQIPCNLRNNNWVVATQDCDFGGPWFKTTITVDLAFEASKVD